MHRQIFRHIMRNTSRGRRPECLPFDETFLMKAKRFPKSEEEVRREIKNQFTNPGSSGTSPFEALETSTSRSTALYPENVPSELPAFVLPMNTVLTGESASFLLFEKRYLKMIEDSPHLFVHLPSRKENIRTSGIFSFFSHIAHSARRPFGETSSIRRQTSPIRLQHRPFGCNIAHSAGIEPLNEP